MNILSLIILSFIFAISIVRNTLYQLFLWQLKEYRLDRFFVHLNTSQGRRLLFGKMATVKWLLLIFSPILLFLRRPSLLFLAVLLLFSFEALLYIRQLLTGGWKTPVFTLKTIFILIAVLSLLSAGCFILPLNFPVKVLIFDRTLFLLVTILVVLMNIPAKIFQKFTIAKAKKKIENHPELLVIGITGSYGKTSTKEFLSQILSQKFKVLKTPANINTDIGVAKTILRSLKKEHQVFICEMGAYKRGEIKAICEIITPQIGIITGIDEQHLSLFGDLRNTIATKFELIESLPKKGLAVFNGNNKYCLKMAERAKKMGREVKIIKGQKVNFRANLPGRHFLENILMANAVAEKLGIMPKEIAQVVKKLKLPPHRMQLFKKNDLTIIDDTYNSNPQGVLAALDYLRACKGKKILVFQPMIELGIASGGLHEKVGKKAGEICDLIILTNRNFYQDFLKGVRGRKAKVSLEKDLPKMTPLLVRSATFLPAVRQMANLCGREIKKGAILFEGREAGNKLKLLITDFEH